MKLLTQQLEQQFAKAGKQDIPNPLVIAKFFNPCGNETWWATSYDPIDRVFFGYVSGFAYDELGYFSLDELAAIKGPLGIGIERDMYFTPQPLDDIKYQIANQQFFAGWRQAPLPSRRQPR